MSRPVWIGLAVIDRDGHLVVWRGSETPKLYHSEEQAEARRLDGCTFEAVALFRVSDAELQQLRTQTLHATAFTPLEEVPRAPSRASERVDAANPRYRPAPQTAPIRPAKKRVYRKQICADCRVSYAPAGPRSHCPACGSAARVAA